MIEATVRVPRTFHTASEAAIGVGPLAAAIASETRAAARAAPPS